MAAKGSCGSHADERVLPFPFLFIDIIHPLPPSLAGRPHCTVGPEKRKGKGCLLLPLSLSGYLSAEGAKNQVLITKFACD